MKSNKFLRKLLSLSVSAVMVFGAAAANVVQTTVLSADAAVEQTVNEVQLNLSFEKPSNWEKNVYVYFYNEDGGTAVNIEKWPGVAMESKDGKVYSVSCTATSENWLVIFNDTKNQVPSQMSPGFEFKNNGYYTANGLDHIMEEQIAVEEIKLDKTSAEINVGEEVTLKATILPKDATNKKVNWYSGDSTIATVKNGVVKGLKAGKVTITAIADDNEELEATAEITVKELSLPELQNGIYFERPLDWGEEVYAYFYNENNDSLANWPGLKMQVTDVSNVIYKFETDKDLTGWFVVFSDKKTQSPAAGQQGFEFQNKGYYTVKGFDHLVTTPAVAVEQVVLDKDKAEVEVGKTVTLKATVLPENAANQGVTWKSSDTKIVTVSSKGVVKGIKVGQATVTATSEENDEISASAVITVKDTAPVVVDVESVKLDKESAEIEIGGEVTLTATVLPENATNKEVVWTTSDETVATVSNGVVKGVKAGEATITATSKENDKISASAVVTVKEETVLPLINSSYLSKTKIALGETVEIHCDAKGGAGGYQYQVRYMYMQDENENPKWVTLQRYDENTVVSFKPTAIGTYSINVNVSDDGDSVAKKYLDLTVDEAAPAKPLQNTSTVSAESISLGEKIDITAAATGGTAPYLYQVLYKQQSADKWSSAQSYGTNANVSIKPTKATVYDICVKVKDSKNTEVKKYFEVDVIDNSPKNLSTISASSIVLGENVVVTAKASGSTGFFQYAFYYKRVADSKWICRQSYKPTSVATIKPSFAEPYDICVKVKDDKGTIAKKYFTLDVTNPAEELTNVSAISATEVDAGDTVIVSAYASGSTGFYKYAVSFRADGEDEWIPVQDYSPENTVPFSLEKAGKYEVLVSVISSKGGEAKKTFNVTVL